MLKHSFLLVVPVIIFRGFNNLLQRYFFFFKIFFVFFLFYLITNFMFTHFVYLFAFMNCYFFCVVPLICVVFVNSFYNFLPIIFLLLLLSAKHYLSMPNLFITSGWAYLFVMTSPLIHFPPRLEALQLPVQA